MLLLWLFDAALTILSWLVALFPATPLLLPVAPSLTVPVPFVGAGGTGQMNGWFSASISISLALLAGRVLQWTYSLIPLKAT